MPYHIVKEPLRSLSSAGLKTPRVSRSLSLKLDLHPKSNLLLRSLAYTKRDSITAVLRSAIKALPKDLSLLGLAVTRKGKVTKLGDGKNLPGLQRNGSHPELEVLIAKCKELRLSAPLVLHQGLLAVLRDLGPENLVEVPSLDISQNVWFKNTAKRVLSTSTGKYRKPFKCSQAARDVVRDYGLDAVLEVFGHSDPSLWVPHPCKTEGFVEVSFTEHKKLYDLAKKSRISMRYVLEIAAELTRERAKQEATANLPFGPQA